MVFQDSSIKRIAQAGLTAKGVVYTLLGVLAFMAAFHINGQSVQKTDKSGVFDFVEKQTGGQVILAVIALGLFCYCIWRAIQALGDTDNEGTDAKGLITRGRHLASGLIYGYAAVHAVQLLCAGKSGSGDKGQRVAGALMDKPLGEWMVGAAAVILLAIGIHQIYYGLSEKFKKHITKRGGDTKLLYAAGKIGYIARGLVWIIIGYLFFKSAINENARMAGNTSKAFAFVEDTQYGPYLLAAIAIGLICYGVFNFIRVRYDHFE